MPTRPPTHRNPWVVSSAAPRGPRLYDSQAWKKARDAYKAKHPTCVKCGAPVHAVDHVVPHKGDRTLFWDSRNWQSLCERCHNAKCGRESAESRGFRA